jgi:hypothetical protein
MAISFHDYRGTRTAARQREQIARAGCICGRRVWSDREDQTLRRSYPDYAAARRELPHRTTVALLERARRLRIARTLHTWADADFVKLRRLYPSAAKQELLAAFPGLSLRAIERAAERKHIRRKKRTLQNTGDALLDAIRERARSICYSMSDLDERAQTKRFFERRGWTKLRHPAYDRLYSAVEALDGEMLPPIDSAVPNRLPQLPSPTTLTHRKHWTAADVSRLGKLYRWAPTEALIAAFPCRSFEQIKRMASRYALRRPRALKPIGHPLFDYLRREAQAQGYSMTKLDRLARSRMCFFSKPSAQRRMNRGALGRAAAALKVSVRLVWSDAD